MANAIYNQMDNKQKQTNLLPKISFANDYDRFIIDATEKAGDYIVENAVDEMTNLGIDATIFDGETPAIAEVSETMTRSASYVYNIRKDELKKVANDTEALNGLRDKIYSNLDEQDRKDCWRQFPILLSKNGNMKGQQKVQVADKTDYAQILLDIKQDIRDCRKPSDLYNSYTKQVIENGEPVTKTLKTFADRCILFIKASLLDEIMVKYEAGVFNLEKIALDCEIIPVNEFYTDDSHEAVLNGGEATIDESKQWIVCGYEYVKIYRDFENRADFNDLRSERVGKTVDYKEYLSKLVPAKLHYYSE